MINTTAVNGYVDLVELNNITFEALENNPDVLSDLQNHLYDVVYLNMQLAPSSGAFYILDTTVNNRSRTPYYSGIYLKYINIYYRNVFLDFYIYSNRN